MSESLMAGVEPVASEGVAEEAVVTNAEVMEGQGTQEIEGKPDPVSDPSEFLLPKFKSVEDQAKAYGELEKRFGGFNGAPEAYELAVPEGLVEEGSDIEVSLDAEDPLLQEFQSLAKDLNMSQEAFDKILGVYLKQQVGSVTSAEAEKAAFAKQEMAQLGEDAPVLLGKMKAWGDSNIPEEHRDGFADLVTSAAGAKAMDWIIGNLVKNAPIPDNFAPIGQQQGITQADIDAEFFKTNEHGQRLMSVDPAHREKVRKMRERFLSQRAG